MNASPVSAAVAASITALKGAVRAAGSASADIARHALALVVVHAQSADDVCDAMRDAGDDEVSSQSVAVYCSQFRRIVASGMAADVYAQLEAEGAWMTFASIIRIFDVPKVTNRGPKPKSPKGPAKVSADDEGDPVNPAKGLPRLTQWQQSIGDIVAKLPEETSDMELSDLLRKVQVKLGAIIADAKAKAKAK